MRKRITYDRRGARPRQTQMRRELTAEAARIMAEEGVRDFQSAKRKAAARLNLPAGKNLPSNEEIEEALKTHVGLFHAELPETLNRLRGTALEAMRFFARFEPRLVGSILNGAVTPFTEVSLHIAAPTVEEVAFFLDERGIAYEQTERRLRFGGDRVLMLPVFHFIAGDTPVELWVLNAKAARETPLSPIDGKPMRRAPLREVEALTQGT